MTALNDLQRRSIFHAFVDMDRQLTALEAEMSVAEHASPFSRAINDLTPTEVRVLREYFGRIRSAMVACLNDLDYPLDVQQTALRWTLLTRLMFVKLPLEEVGPKQLRGYGPVSAAGRDEVLKVQDEIARLIDRATAFVRQGLGRDLGERLARLDAAAGDVRTLGLLERIVTKHNLVEFRPQLESLARRYEKLRFEIAVFGRVSSGKSSLLNHLAGENVLPVGVTPITAVPTRMERGETAECIVTLAESGQRRVELSDLREYASEERNPNNHRHVTDIVVRLPSRRLREGVVLVDTPGIGSLALSGAASTMAYLPRCDLGVVLIDASSAPSHDDIDLVRRLYEAGVPAQVLLSKADLVPENERKKFVEYVRSQLLREFRVELPVHPVSVVGPDAALLSTWFDREITPLLDRSRELAAASLRRKTAALRESVIAVLETLRQRPRGEAASRRLADYQKTLDAADWASREARSIAWNWADRDQSVVDGVVANAAHALVGAASQTNPTAESLRLTLAERGQQALQIVQDLQKRLGAALVQLNEAAIGAAIDAGAITGLAIGGLPDVDLTRFRMNGQTFRPWWSSMAPSWAERAAGRALRKRIGSAIADQVVQYDRQLQLWLRRAVGQIVEAYEAQAAVVREQLRRLHGNATAQPTNASWPDIDADLQELRTGNSPSPELTSRQT